MEMPDRTSITWTPHKWNQGSNHRYTKPGNGGVYGGTSSKTAAAEINHYGAMDGRVHVSQDFELNNVLDLTDSNVRKQLGVSLDDLTGDSYDITHKIGDSAIENGFDGILLEIQEEQILYHLKDYSYAQIRTILFWRRKLAKFC